MPSPAVTISQRGVERILSGHVWIYRADVLDAREAGAGAIVCLRDRRRHFWGRALYSSKSQIALRLLTREERSFDRAFLAERVAAAASFRQQVVDSAQAYRLVSAEGDLLPSLIIDRYGPCFVIQTLSQGMDRLKAQIVEILQQAFSPHSILERNDVAARELEGLPEH
jgi:23S rRNA (cytosine1962-C5)-methyltransferase